MDRQKKKNVVTCNFVKQTDLHLTGRQKKEGNCKYKKKQLRTKTNIIGHMDRQTDKRRIINLVKSNFINRHIYIWTKGQTDRHKKKRETINIGKSSFVNRKTDEQTDGQTDKRKERHYKYC